MIIYACIERNPKSLVTQMKSVFSEFEDSTLLQRSRKHFKKLEGVKWLQIEEIVRENRYIESKDTTAKNIKGGVTNSINPWWRSMAKVSHLQERKPLISVITS